MIKSPRIPAASGFLGRLRARQVTMGVIGLGYTGLPLAMASARACFTTFGYDIGAEICDGLNRGVSHIGDVPDETVRAARADGLFTAVAGELETAVAAGLSPVPDVVFLCVPTPFENGPDLSSVRAAARAVARVLRPGMVIVAQSTSYPGTTTEVIQPLLEESGLRAGRDFALAFAPERIDPGNTRWNINTTPRLVGGVTPQSTRLASAALGAVLGKPGLIRQVASPAVAEFAKLLENSYRLVNIGLVNELAVLAHEMSIDIAEVIDAAATKPYGFQPFYPGVGPGGACIPEDPLYLAWKARTLEFDPRLIDLAVQQNQDMARYVLVRLFDMLSRRGKALAGSRVLCVGAGYKPGVADTRHSRALRIMELLCQAGAEVDYSDDVIPSLEVAATERKSVDLGTVEPAAYDLVAVLSAKQGLDLERFLAVGVPVFDAARALARRAPGDVERLLLNERRQPPAAPPDPPRGGNRRPGHSPPEPTQARNPTPPEPTQARNPTPPEPTQALVCVAQRGQPGGQHTLVAVDTQRLVPAGRPRQQRHVPPPHPERVRHRPQRSLGGLPLDRPGHHPHHQRVPPAPAYRRPPRSRHHPHRDC